MQEIYDLMALKGLKMRLLDIGGGFPVQYLDPIMPIQKFCEPINDALNNYFSDARVIAEPGRVIAGDAVVLVTKVVGKSCRNNAQWYYIDDGLYNSFSGKVYDHANYRIVSERKGRMSRCVLAGPTCDSFDVISNDIVLPELCPRGAFFWRRAWGLTRTQAPHAFNGLEKAHIVPID